MGTTNFFKTLENSQKFIATKQILNQEKGNFKMVGHHQEGDKSYKTFLPLKRATRLFKGKTQPRKS